MNRVTITGLGNNNTHGLVIAKCNVLTLILVFLAATHIFICPVDSYANGASAAFGLGGLEFIEETDISIEKEDLRISPDIVSVKYVFRNNSDRDKNVLIAFPLPPFDNRWNFEGLPELFKVTVSGEQIDIDTEYRAFLYSHINEVTELLKHYGIPIFGAGSDKITEIINSLDEETRTKLYNRGVVIRNGDMVRNGVKTSSWSPGWSVETKYYWEQTFPASEIIEMSVSYRPLTGGSDMFTLSTAINFSKSDSDDINIRRFSIMGPEISKKCSSGENLWIESVLNTYEGYDANEIALYNSDVQYILSSGSYWSGPIKNFELEVSGDEYAGVCFDTDIDGDITRIDNSTIKVHVSNFEPKGNLNAHFYSVMGIQEGGYEEY